MSFGGAAGAMITSMKNNKRERVSAFKKLESYEGVNHKLYFEKKASKEMILKLRKKMQKQQQKSFLIKAIVLSIVLVMIIYIVGFY